MSTRNTLVGLSGSLRSTSCSGANAMSGRRGSMYSCEPHTSTPSTTTRNPRIPATVRRTRFSMAGHPLECRHEGDQCLLVLFRQPGAELVAGVLLPTQHVGVEFL